MRCAYCHNPNLVLNHGEKEDSELISFLESRRGRLTGVVFSGGEATFCPSLPELARRAQSLGYKVKLDTNGTNPAMLRRLIDEKLLDSLALDYKCPPPLAEQVTGNAHFVTLFQESLAYAIKESRAGNVELEIRTTCHTGLLDETDLQWIIDDLDARGYPGVYWLQNAVSTGDKTLGNIFPPDRLPDFERLTSPKHFKLGFRNFPSHIAKLT